MKIRTDFVSNSSSSSFILAGDKNSFLMVSKLSKNDFIEAICDLGSFNPPHDKKCFTILDKTLPEDLKKIKSKWSDWLKSWYNPYLVRIKNDDDECTFISPLNELKKRKEYRFNLDIDDFDFDVPGFHLRKWDKFYETLRDAYCRTKNIHLPFDWTPACKSIEIYDHEKKQYFRKKLNSGLYDMLKIVYNDCGIMTNHDALMSDFSRMIFHFGDNDVYCIKDMDYPGKYEMLYTGESDYDKEHNEQIKNSIYETESYSMFRFCEILVKWFKDHGKIPADSKLTWKDMANSMVACCMHEG